MTNANPYSKRLVSCYSNQGSTLTTVGLAALYVSLAGIFLWVGGMKFTAYEAQAILVSAQNSPVTSWLYPLFGFRA